MLILIIAGGPDKGRIYELNDGEPIVLGREGDQVKLNDRKCSREHARLWSEGGQWYLEDLGSRHGTHRNHTLLTSGQRAKIKDGDYLQIGNTVMVLGRMPVDHAKRLALIGEMGAPEPAKRSKAPMVATGVLLAAVIGLGGYVTYKLETLSDQTVSKESFEALQQQLIASQRQETDRIAESIDRQAGVSRELLTQHQRLATSLDETTQTLGRHETAVASATELINGQTVPIIEKLDAVSTRAEQQQAAIHRLGEMLAHQQANDQSPKLLAAMEQIERSLADQPKAEVLLAKLDEAVKLNAQGAGEAVQQALAEHRASAEIDGLTTAKASDALLTRVLEGLSKVPTREQVAREVQLAFADRNAKNEQFMRLVLAEVRKTGDQIATDVTAVAREDAGQAQALMQKVVSELDKRPSGAQLAADLRTAMDQAFTRRDTVQADARAEAESKLAGLMGKVLSELERRPTSEQLAADLRRAIGEDAQRTEVLIARALTEIEQGPTAKQIARELQSADSDSAEKTARLLEQVLAKVEAQQQIGEQLTRLQKQIAELPGRDTQAVREVLTRLDAQSENSAALLKSIGELRAAMPKDLPDQLDQVLAQLDKQVRTDQITDAIEKAMQRIATARDTQTQAAIAQLSQKLEALPSADELSKMVQSQDALAKLLDASDARDAIGELRASLEQLSEKIGDQTAGEGEPGSDQLAEIITMLKQREKVELMLAELHDAMASQSTQTTALKRELMSAVQSFDNPQTTRTLNELMGMVSERMATDASVRQAIRDEMRGTLLPSQMAQADARDIATTGGNTNASQSTPSPSPQGKRLTTLEAAYKKSFESGEPVTVGAGAVDPQTGQVSKGRRIDPAIAKELGFETWRDWYLTDRHAEQMRLQQEAIRQRNANDADGDSGTIKLPGE